MQVDNETRTRLHHIALARFAPLHCPDLGVRSLGLPHTSTFSIHEAPLLPRFTGHLRCHGVSLAVCKNCQVKTETQAGKYYQEIVPDYLIKA